MCHVLAHKRSVYDICTPSMYARILLCIIMGDVLLRHIYLLCYSLNDEITSNTSMRTGIKIQFVTDTLGKIVINLKPSNTQEKKSSNRIRA